MSRQITKILSLVCRRMCMTDCMLGSQNGNSYKNGLMGSLPVWPGVFGITYCRCFQWVPLSFTERGRVGRNWKRPKFYDIRSHTFFFAFLTMTPRPSRDSKHLRNNCGEWLYSCTCDTPIVWIMFVVFRGVVCLPHLSSLPLNSSCTATFVQVALLWWSFLTVGCE